MLSFALTICFCNIFHVIGRRKGGKKERRKEGKKLAKHPPDSNYEGNGNNRL